MKKTPPAKVPPAETPLALTKAASLLTKPLGLLGWDQLEPVLLAALATGEPMLLIGKHGTAKSFLLERLAQSLGLAYRFYNASLVNYDDLVGIPVPNAQQTSLHYISTPTAIWDAEVVFIDELNRTRPDLQNKLFSIIHEKRVQGVQLDKLRYRWAAMNPPPSDDQDPGDVYLGAEPLDPALADRFGFLIEVPDWCDLSAAEKRSCWSTNSAVAMNFQSMCRHWWRRPPPSSCSSAPSRRILPNISWRWKRSCAAAVRGSRVAVSRCCFGLPSASTPRA